MAPLVSPVWTVRSPGASPGSPAGTPLASAGRRAAGRAAGAAGRGRRPGTDGPRTGTPLHRWTRCDDSPGARCGRGRPPYHAHPPGGMLPDEDPAELFTALRALPFVELGADGLVVHDTVRVAASTLLRASDPTRHRAHRRADWIRLRAELRHAGRADLWRYRAAPTSSRSNPRAPQIMRP